MAFNGSGSFSAPGASFPAVASTLIESAKYNAVINDIATGLSTCILKDGTQTVTANIPFGGFKLTGVGPATARTDAATLANNQDGTGVYVGTVGGTADVITLTPSPAITSYVAGQRFSFIASGANTTNVTVAISSLSAKAITKNGTTALAAGDIPSGALVSITYDGTQFQLSPQTKTLNGTTIAGIVDMTGAVLSGASPLVFEGNTADAFETTLAVTDPTADQTITLPNATIAVGGVLDRDVTQADVVNTIVETTVYSFSVPGGTLGTNKQLRMRMSGDFLNNSGGSAVLTTRVKYGATTIATNGTTITNAGGANRAPIELITCLDAFNSTSAQVSLTKIFALNNGVAGTLDGSGSVALPTTATGHNAIAEDSTAAKTLSITFQWTVANANISARAHVVNLELVG